MPASNTRALEKAKVIPADGFIFDLEDAVAPSSKKEARETMRIGRRAGCIRVMVPVALGVERKSNSAAQVELAERQSATGS